MHQAVREFILWTWCLPQTLLGAGVGTWNALANKTIRAEHHRGHALVVVKNWTWLAGISLGRFVFVREDRCDGKTVNHEFAHVTQSYLFGPLYLLVIGVPSILLALRVAIQPSFRKQYLTTWPESWTERIREQEEKEGKGYRSKKR
jgi:hypothetical protein